MASPIALEDFLEQQQFSHLHHEQEASTHAVLNVDLLHCSP